MNLGELLTLLREAVLNDRTDRAAGTSDYLWTDQTLVTYINEAQRKYCALSLALRDGSTDAATLVTLAAGQSEYVLHPSVLAVVSAKLTTAHSDLVRVGHPALSAYRAPTERWIDPAQYSAYPAGATLAYSTDEQLASDGGPHERAVLRVYPTPDADANGRTIRLRVVRKPLVKFTVADIADENAIPEIPEDHHIEMLDWAAYLALRIVDDDAGAPRRAAEFKATFEENARRARAEAMRKMFAPMGWGFGRHGFTWEK